MASELARPRSGASIDIRKYDNPSIRELLVHVEDRPDMADGEHFVDRHRAELIRRVTLVDPILDDLYQYKLLTTEAYDTVRHMRPSQEQMRELFRHVESWGNEDKDRFLKSLRKNNHPLIRSLQKDCD